MGQERSKTVDSKDLEIFDEATGRYVVIEGIKVRLARPMSLDFEWIGGKKVLSQLLSSWFCSHPGERPMNPRLVGKPGVGKTAIAYAAGKIIDKDVYLFQGTADTTPKDLLINPIVVETGKDTSKVEYIASTMVSAMITGSICILDEGNRMQEKAWASLAPLLDSRCYVESVAVGLLIKAHPEFKFICTMNDDASCFEIPEYIQSRLHPYISLGYPDKADERKILESNLPYTNARVLDYVSSFLVAARAEGEEYSPRDGIHIANYAGKIVEFAKSLGQNIDPSAAVLTAVEQVLGVKQTRYIKRIIWEEQENKSSY